jgi:hypothetical protein
MRNRHIPRLCRVCTSPMGGQEETCWNCGAVYAAARPAGAPPSASGDQRWDDDGGHAPRPAVPVAA